MPPTAAGPPPDAAALKKLSARLTPVELRADAEVAKLPASERAALVKILQAAQIMDALFLRQVWAGNQTLLLDLLREDCARRSGGNGCTRSCRTRGPGCGWIDDRPFLPGVPPEAAGGHASIPPGATKAEIENWLGTLPAERAPTAEGFFTTIRRAPDGKLIAVPYSLEYQAELARGGGAAATRRRALTTQPTLKAFLEARAAAFLSNDYYASDVAWMKLDASIEPTIGPVRGVRGRLVQRQGGVRGVRHPARRRRDREAGASSRGELQDIENHLPIDPEAAQPEDRGAGPHPGGQLDLLARATPTAACRPPRSTCPTTSASPRRWAPSARC